jgi:basic membrane lipoprotein Med (substrate-binding protein (PBP1-ABC) superfamily)
LKEATIEVLKSLSVNRWRQITSLGLVIGSTVLLLAILSSWSLTTDSAHANTVSVGLVTDKNTLADQSWNWTSYQGLRRAESELGGVGKERRNLQVDGYIIPSFPLLSYQPGDLVKLSNSNRIV